MRGRRLGTGEFSRVYEEHLAGVYGFFVYRLQSREDAEDLTQLTFERALKAWRRYDERKASVNTWLMAIARNLLVDHYRERGAKGTVPLDEVLAGQEPKSLVEHPEYDLGLSPELANALQLLGQREREVIALRYGSDLEGPEIAKLLGLSLANVHQISSRALRKLREELSAEDGPDNESRASDQEAGPGES